MTETACGRSLHRLRLFAARKPILRILFFSAGHASRRGHPLLTGSGEAHFVMPSKHLGILESPYLPMLSVTVLLVGEVARLRPKSGVFSKIISNAVM